VIVTTNWSALACLGNRTVTYCCWLLWFVLYHAQVLLSLPSDGALREHTGGADRCPIDNYRLLVHVIGDDKMSHNKNFLLCPRCYSSAADERKADYMFYGVGCEGFGCERCEQGKCPFSMKLRTVSRCVDTSCPGSMVIDEIGSRYNASGGKSKSGGGHWKLACNYLGCLKIVRLHDVVRSRVLVLVLSVRRRCVDETSREGKNGM